MVTYSAGKPMSEPFDPYQTWLEIPPGKRPPDYYRLLGLRRFEKRAEAIEAAADARVAALQPHLSGDRAQPAAKLLAEVHAARLCLLNDNRRAAYDVGLLQAVAASVAEEEKGGPQTQITAAEFLALLAERDLVSGDLLTAIRKQMSDAKSYVTAQHVGKLLVDKGLLTPKLVSRLLESGARAGLQTGPTSAETLWKAETDELTLAPLDDEPQQKHRDALPLKKPAAAQAPVATPRSSAGQGKPAASPAQPTAASGSLLDEELQALAGVSPAGPLDRLLSDPSFQATAGAGSPLLSVHSRRRKQRFWTTPGFLIGAAIAWVLLLIGAMTVVVMNRPGDDEREPGDGSSFQGDGPRFIRPC
jgi:hypothetical protein